MHVYIIFIIISSGCMGTSAAHRSFMRFVFRRVMSLERDVICIENSDARLYRSTWPRSKDKMCKITRGHVLRFLELKLQYRDAYQLRKDSQKFIE